eukprot:scaffold2817_cov130-Cylindrotheca_fusiformis.AAC.19
MEMVRAPSEGFGDDLPERRSKSGESHINSSADNNNQRKFVSGDELHKLRHDVMAMRLELQEARRSGSQLLVRALEKAIMNAQKVDAEFVYAVSMERRALAEEKGKFQDAERFRLQAMEARNALPQFQLEGLWVGKYGENGYEMINVTYVGDVMHAQKVTSNTNNVPKGQVSFEVDLSPNKAGNRNEFLDPIKLGDSAAEQWGSKYLQRFPGKGQIAADGFQDSQWINGQLIMVNEFFSFAWLPIGHQVFFGRPTPELILKLMKDDKKQEIGNCSARTFLEKCWEETEHIEDDLEVNEGYHYNDGLGYYPQDGCFE